MCCYNVVKVCNITSFCLSHVTPLEEFKISRFIVCGLLDFTENYLHMWYIGYVKFYHQLEVSDGKLGRWVPGNEATDWHSEASGIHC